MSKLSTTLEDICEGIPEEFLIYFKYVRNLNFTEQPNYKMLKKLFTDLYRKQGFKRDYLYDWIKIEGGQKKLCADFLRL
jgi:hypothetical protein